MSTPPDEPVEAIVVCYRVADLPVATRDAAIEHCSVCRHEVWRGVMTPRSARNVCWQCAPATDFEVVVSPRQRELWHESGFTDAEIERERRNARAWLAAGRAGPPPVPVTPQ